ncbi:MAG TPA: cytochrome c [Xanthobacteraceae bacterium]|jgi:mono/diheme cytochrome c family protein|nr:cytochrome c [Xanthobacteraceae bacterium]
MRSICFVLALLVPVIAHGNTAHAASADKGKTAFIKHGCWQCHDFAGEGSVATSNGRVIARTQLPLDAFKSFVRTTDGQMPPFRAAVLGDDELDDIYAYLQSLPAPKAVSDIPLLNGMRTQ